MPQFESDPPNSGEEEASSGSDDSSDASKSTDGRKERRVHGGDRSDGRRKKEQGASKRKSSYHKTQRDPTSRRKYKVDDSLRHSTHLVQFQTDNEDSAQRPSSSNDSAPERDEDLSLTRFQECNRAEATNIIQPCGCALCKTYGKIRRLDKGRILRA